MRVSVQLSSLCTPWAGPLSFNVGRPLCCWFSCTVFVVVSSSLLSFAENFRSPYLGRAKSSATHSYLWCAFSCVQTRVGLPVFRIFNMRTDVDAYAAHRLCTDLSSTH